MLGCSKNARLFQEMAAFDQLSFHQLFCGIEDGNIKERQAFLEEHPNKRFGPSCFVRALIHVRI